MSTLCQAIKSAHYAAKCSDYNYVVILDSNGDYWIERDYPGRYMFPDEKVVGRVSASWEHGILTTKYMSVGKEGKV